MCSSIEVNDNFHERKFSMISMQYRHCRSRGRVEGKNVGKRPRLPPQSPPSQCLLPPNSFCLIILHESSAGTCNMEDPTEDPTESSIPDSSASPVPESLHSKTKRTRLAASVLPTRVSSACERCRLHKSRVSFGRRPAAPPCLVD